MCGCAHARVCLGPYQLRRAFKHFDRDYSGSITVHEFTHVMRNFGYPSSHYQYPSSHDFSRYSPYRYPYSRDLYHYSQNHCARLDARHAHLFLGMARPPSRCSQVCVCSFSALHKRVRCLSLSLWRLLPG